MEFEDIDLRLETKRSEIKNIRAGWGLGCVVVDRHGLRFLTACYPNSTAWGGLTLREHLFSVAGAPSVVQWWAMTDGMLRSSAGLRG
jgi:hypothetical protein